MVCTPSRDYAGTESIFRQELYPTVGQAMVPVLHYMPLRYLLITAIAGPVTNRAQQQDKGCEE